MKMYQVTEHSNKKGYPKSYMMNFENDQEFGKWLKAREEYYGYIPGLGGDKTYSIVGWWVGSEGQYYADLNKYGYSEY